MTPTRALAAASGLALAASLALGMVVHTDTSTEHTTTTACTELDVSETSGVTLADIEDLRAQGWYGVQTDHAERLYSPGCATA